MSGVLQDNTVFLLAKSEGTSYGVDAAPTAADNAFMPKSFSWEPDFSEVAKPRIAATFRSTGVQIGTLKLKWKCTFDFGGPADPGGGNPYTEPKWVTFARACGIAVAATGTPVDTHTLSFSTRVNQESLTIYHGYWDEGANEARQTKLLGARATMSFQVGVNEAFEIMFEGEALFGGDSDLSNQALPTYAAIAETDDAANGKAMLLTIGGVSTDVTSIKYKSNRSLAQINSVLETYGVKRILIDSKPGSNHEIEMDRELVLKATRDFFDEVLGEAKVAWSITIDSSGGNRCVIAGSRLQMAGFKFEGKDGHMRVPQKFLVCDSSSAGDNALTITLSRTP